MMGVVGESMEGSPHAVTAPVLPSHPNPSHPNTGIFPRLLPTPTDIAGYTSMSKDVTPQAVMAFLNTLFR